MKNPEIWNDGSCGSADVPSVTVGLPRRGSWYKLHDAIELFFLPPYALELNPDELACAHIKARVAKATVQTKQELKAKVERVMHRLQKLPNIVAGFFGTPACAYAKVGGFACDWLDMSD